MNPFALEIRVVQTLNGIHGLIRVVHVYKREVFYNRTLRYRPIIFKQSSELILCTFLNIGHVQLDRALVFAVAGLNINGSAM